MEGMEGDRGRWKETEGDGWRWRNVGGIGYAGRTKTLIGECEGRGSRRERGGAPGSGIGLRDLTAPQ